MAPEQQGIQLRVSDSCMGVLSAMLPGKYSERFLGEYLGAMKEITGVQPQIEMLAWQTPYRLQEKITLAKMAGYEIGDLHGGVGLNWSSVKSLIKTLGIKPVMTPVDQLVNEFAGSHEMLFHNTELSDPYRFGQVVAACQYKDKNIWIENDVNDGALREAVGMVRDLRASGVAAGIMFDIAHFIGIDTLVNKDTFPQVWKEGVQLIASKFSAIKEEVGVKEDSPIGLHVEIGQVADSIPLEWMSSAMFADLATALTQGGVSVVVIENQQVGVGMVLTSPLRMKRIIHETENMVELLGKLGIFHECVA